MSKFIFKFIIFMNLIYFSHLFSKNEEEIVSKEWPFLNIYVFYDSLSVSQFNVNRSKASDELKIYLTKIFNNNNSSEASISRIGLSKDYDNNYAQSSDENESDDIIFYDQQVGNIVEEDYSSDNQFEIFKIKFELTQKVNGKTKNSTFFFINTYLFDTNRNYIKQSISLNKLIKLNKLNSEVNDTELENEKKSCRMHSRYENQHSMLFLSDSKYSNLFMHLWNDLPVFLVDAKNFKQLNSTMKLQYDSRSPYFPIILLNFIIKTHLYKSAHIKKDSLNSIILEKLLPVKHQQQSLFHINILLISEDNTLEDDIFYESIMDVIKKYNSNINYYFIDSINTDSDEAKNQSDYSYGPHNIYQSYMRDFFFSASVRNNRFKINLKSIKFSRKLNFFDIKRDYNMVVMRRMNDYYSKLLNYNQNQTIILLDVSIESLKKYKIEKSSNDIFILNSFLFDQIYSKTNLEFFLNDFFKIAKNAYKTYLINEMYSCLKQYGESINDEIESNKMISLSENFDFKKIINKTFCSECWYMKSFNKNGYVNDPAYSIYSLKFNNNKTFPFDFKLTHQYGSLYHKTFIDFQKSHHTLVQMQIRKPQSSGINSSSNDFYIVVAYDEQPYIFVEELSTDDETICDIESMICYEIDSAERVPREFFNDLNSGNKHKNTSNRIYGNFQKRCCYGISISILKIINTKIKETGQRELKFYLYVLKHSTILTNKKSNKLLNLADEVVYDLYTFQADFSIAPLSVSRRHEKLIDYTTEFYHDNFVIIGKRDFSNTSLLAFLAPFEWSMWIGVFLTLNIAALVETLYEWLSPYGLTPRGRNRIQVWSLASALTLCWSVIFSHTFKTKSPKCWATRWLGNVWGSFAVIFIASYTANLAAVMVSSRRMYQITGITDPNFSEKSIYRCGIITNSSAELFLQTSSQYKHLHKNLIKYRYDSTIMGIRALSENKINFLITEHSIATYYVLKSVNRTFEIIGDPFGKLAFSFAFRKESSIFNLISNKILNLKNDGTIEKMLTDWFLDWKCDKGPIFQQTHKYGLETLSGVFILLSCGMIVGAATLGVEWLAYKYSVPYLKNKNWIRWLCFSQRLHWAVNQPLCKSKRFNVSPTRLQNIGNRLYNHLSRTSSGVGGEDNRFRYKLSCNSRINKRLLYRNQSTQTTIDDFEILQRNTQPFNKTVEKVKLIEFKTLVKFDEEFERLKKENEELIERIIELTTNTSLKKANLL